MSSHKFQVVKKSQQKIVARSEESDAEASGTAESSENLEIFGSEVDEGCIEDENNVHPGLILNQKYVLLKKIGSGANADVWMVYCVTDDRYYAIKIQFTQCFNEGCREVAIIKHINKYAEEHPDEDTYCVKMFDFFIIEENENTKYVCSVYELYAGSIFMLVYSGKYKYGLPIPVVKNILRQLLRAVDSLHNKLKVIHADIKPENILFKGIPPSHLKIVKFFQESNFKKKYQELKLKHGGEYTEQFQIESEILAVSCVDKIVTEIDDFLGDETQSESDVSGDFYDVDDEDSFGDDDEDSGENENESEENSKAYNTRKQSVKDLLENLDYTITHNLDESGEYDFVSVLNNTAISKDRVDIIDDKYVVHDCKIALTDFGNSYFYEKRTQNEIQARSYRAPEIIMDFKYGYSCDVWSIGCVAYELLTGFVLFEVSEASLTKDIHHLYLIEKLLGPIPTIMKRKSPRKRFLFDQQRDFHIKNIEAFSRFTLEDRLVKQLLFRKEDAKDIAEFLSCFFSIVPSDRWTPSQLLNHKWLAE